MEPTPLQRLAANSINADLNEWIDERRRAGKSYRLIARELATVTDGIVDVSDETIRLWDLAEPKAKAS